MPNPYPASFRDDNSETRLAGVIDFTDSGNQPGGTTFVPTAIKLANGAATDVHAVGNHPLTWTSATDPATGSPIVAVPASLGLTIDLSGVSPNISPTVDGTWAFTLEVVPSADATVQGSVFVTSTNAAVPFGPVGATDGSTFGVSAAAVSTGVSGVTPFDVAEETLFAAAANPYTIYCELTIVRLA